MNITEKETFVKQNYILSREWVTAYTQLNRKKSFLQNRVHIKRKGQKYQAISS